jgi:hypothetical protein
MSEIIDFFEYTYFISSTQGSNEHEKRYSRRSEVTKKQESLYNTLDVFPWIDEFQTITSFSYYKDNQSTINRFSFSKD